MKIPGHLGVLIKPENTEIDRNRNWALKTAAKQIALDPRSAGKSIDVKRSKDRGVVVDGQPAFVQLERFSKGGEFVGAYANLKLP